MVVGRGGDDGHPARNEPADRLVKDVGVGQAAVSVVPAPLGDAHVDRLDQRPARIGRVALRRDPVEAADVRREQADAAVVEDLDGPQPDAGSDPDDARGVVDRADRPGHVGPVAVSVAPGGRVG